jgi:predicted aspartyl protease
LVQAVSNHAPYIQIRLKFAGDNSPLEVEALVDTGFDGFVAFPQSRLPDSVRAVGRQIWTLADGSRSVSSLYEGTAEVLGIAATFTGDVAMFGREIMVGRRFTDHFRVTFDHGRQVLVEP